jgi:2-(1,2-epoxy-1,2-dihydrophenyl)acetyl-CoA isomerase
MVAEVGEVEVTRDGAVLTITLNRPEVLNALNRAVHQGIQNALEQARDASIRAVVITGAGRGFCVGQDLQEFSGGAGDVAQSLRDNYHRNVLAIRALEKPVIAAVNGPAAGAGLSLALACDIRLASDAASFVPAFINIGLVPDSGGTWLVRRLLGTARAFEWLTTGRKLSADEARTMGLVSEVVPAADFADRTREISQYFATLPTRAVWQTKRLLDAAETSTFEEQLELEATTQAEQTRTHDFTEGVAAFFEKRDASFTGEPVEPARGAPVSKPAAASGHSVDLVLSDDLKRNRLTVFFRPLLAIPQLIWVALWGVLAALVVMTAWVPAILLGRMPTPLHRFVARYLRAVTHVTAYVLLLANPWPPFGGGEGSYPVDLRIDGPARQNRLTVLFRLLLVIPAALLAYVFRGVNGIVALLGWFYCLVFGRMHPAMRDLSTSLLRYEVQTYAYLFLLTGRYPSLTTA